MSTAISMTDRARILAPTVERSQPTRPSRSVTARLTDHPGKTLHQTAVDDHPLLNAEHGYLILVKERLDAYVKTSFRRWVVRRLFDWCGVAGETRCRKLGIVLYEDLAIQIVTQRNLEAPNLKPGDPWYGCVWQWEKMPVSSLLGEEAVRYGKTEYSGTDIDKLHRARKLTTLVPLESIARYQDSSLDETFRLLEEKVKQVASSVKPAPVV